MISIVAKFTVQEGKDTAFDNVIQPLIEASNAEEGCIEYILHKHTELANTFCLIEKWKDEAAVDFHNNTAHFTSAVPQLKEIAAIEIDVYETL